MILRINWREFHHLYWGLVCLALGVFGLFRGWPAWCCALLLFVGLILAIDDANQHWGNGRSPIHDLFVRAWDKVFGNWWPFHF